MASPPFRLSRRCLVKTRTAGSYSLTSTTWANVDTGMDIAIPASVGDTLRAGISALWNNESFVAALQVATWNGSSLVNWFGSGEPTTTTGDGIMSWYSPSVVDQKAIGAPKHYQVQAADIVVDTNLGPQVTCRLRYRVGGTKTLLATTGDPLEWWVENIGPAYDSGF